MPRDKFPPHSLAFAKLPISGPSYDVRLLIEPYALTSIQNDRRAARWAATKLIRAERVSSFIQQPVRYGDTQGIMIRNLPGGPGPSLAIIVAHRKAVYLIFVPGQTVGRDQNAALRTLRYIPRSGNFLPPVGGRR